MPSGALVTVSSSDRPSQSPLLCHGFGALSSRSPPCALRRRGRPAPPANLSPVRPALRHLRGLRPRPHLLHSVVPDAWPPPVRAGRPRPASAQSRGATRSPGPAARLSRSATRDGSDFPRTAPLGQTLRPGRRPGSGPRARAMRGLRPVEPVAHPPAGAPRRSEKEGR